MGEDTDVTHRSELENRISIFEHWNIGNIHKHQGRGRLLKYKLFGDVYLNIQIRPYISTLNAYLYSTRNKEFVTCMMSSDR